MRFWLHFWRILAPFWVPWDRFLADFCRFFDFLRASFLLLVPFIFYSFFGICWTSSTLGSWVLGLLGCLVVGCWAVGLLGCLVGLLGGWVVFWLLGCWAVGLLGCWVVGLLGCAARTGATDKQHSTGQHNNLPIPQQDSITTYQSHNHLIWPGGMREAIRRPTVGGAAC